MEYNKILIIVPHPDDEILLSGGFIETSVTANKDVFVAIVTNGDYLANNKHKAELRLSESLNALKSLDVPEENIFFLGYPDTGFYPNESFLYNRYFSKNEYEVISTVVSNETYGIMGIKEDYSFLRFNAHSKYCKHDVVRDIETLINDTIPELIVTTSVHDTHGDHIALSYILRDLIAHKFNNIALWEGVIHSKAGDENWPLIGIYDVHFSCPDYPQARTELKWDERISVPLSEKMHNNNTEKNNKYQLLLSYKTAMPDNEPQVRDYLLSFAKKDEVFFKIY